MRRGAVALFVVVLVSILLLGCPPPAAWNMSQSAYQRNDMVSAFQYAALTLKAKPDYAPAVQFLVDMVPKTYDDLTAKAKQDESQKNWDGAYEFYSQVKAISDAVGVLPGQVDARTKATVNIPTRNVDSLIGNAAQNAAEKHYQEGLSLETASKNKDAAKAFTAAMKYQAGYKDAQTHYDKCRAAAVKRVAIMPFDNTSGKTEYGSVGENLASEIVGKAMEDQSNLEFMEFVSRERLDQLMAEQKLTQSKDFDQASAASVGKLLGINAFVFGKVTSVIPDFPQDIMTTETQEQDLVYTNGTTKHAAAVVYTYDRKGDVKLTASFQIIDVASGTIVKSGSATFDACKEYKWARFTGDPDALKGEAVSLSKAVEKTLPPAEELAGEAVGGAAQDLSRQISAFFK